MLTATGDMTARNVAVRVIKKGREVFEGIFQRTQKNPKFGKVKDPSAKEEPLGHYCYAQTKNSTLLRSSWLKYFHQAKNQSLAKELQNSAIKNFQSGSAALFGRSFGISRRRIPLYALLGFSMGAGGVMTSPDHDQEFTYDRVCEEIKTMFQVGKPHQCSTQQGCSLQDYEFGQLIAKGCNAAVYEARLRNDTHESMETSHPRSEEDESIQIIPEEPEDMRSVPSENSFDMVTDMELASFSTGSDITILSESDSLSNNQELSSDIVDSQLNNDFDLAVKMMFNYDAESQAAAIMQSMKNEVVPAKMADNFGQMMEWENGHHPKKKKRLKPHPNIVDMWAVFVDDVQPFSKCLTEFPHALPSRLNPEGFGRNKTMYLVMKRYNCTLRDYLRQQTPTLHESIMLLAQLVEAVVHLNTASVAHRDIKSDNILLDTSHVVPHLVLSDFGSCLMEDRFGNMKVPYFTEDTCKGGNRSLMAPEVVSASSGYRVYLDYSQSDIWACGAVAYEIFGANNPFYRNELQQRLDSINYKEEDLPDLPDHIPDILQKLVKAMLRRDPHQRPDAVTVANILHLLLWGPPEWTMAMTFGGHPLCKVNIMRWLLTLSAGAVCQRAMQRSTFIAANSPVELQMKSVFLSRLNLEDIHSAIWLAWDLPHSA